MKCLDFEEEHRVSEWVSERVRFNVPLDTL